MDNFKKCTWLYIGTQDVWALFIIVLYLSKYSKMKLGKPHEKPEFNDATYFTMLFAAGIGIGLFYFGVAEPIWHLEPGHYGNRYYARYSDNQRAQDAMNVTFFHWGIHGWIVYVLVGLLLGFLSYRKGLPMTMRSCFYPLLGDRIYGWMGDFIDILSIVCNMFGVCTSLGLGVIQLNAGFKRLNRNIEFSTTNQIITIWGVTVLATGSVISGLKLGIRRLSEICFSIGMVLMLIVLFYDDTWYLLNLYVQSIGYYLQYVVQIGFHTDAFAQLSNAPDKLQASDWMNDWTIFYWGWWIAWCPFVGMFMAKISRGRTIREFINATLAASLFYTFLWLTIFGGAGLRMERNAAMANITCSSPLGGSNATQNFKGLYRLSCRGKNDMWFDLMDQYGDPWRIPVCLVPDCSDSGSLVIDCLSANGDPDPPVPQRVFWALTEGATATALLYAGGADALQALQAVSIAAGLPYTILLCFMCVSLWRAVQMEAGDLDPNGPQFSVSLFNPIIWPSCRGVFKLLLATVAPCHDGGGVHLPVNGISYVGWAVLFLFFGVATAIRTGIREEDGIQGNMVEDFFVVMLLYPFAAYQMDQHVLNHRQTKMNGDVEHGHVCENPAPKVNSDTK
ncbi:hypothetical protein OS493_011155 [Desmophyllum pertusum]|uniref:Uncharacterized protein n=1 Tax=Desmophyllum pertusum TaxID=174260 RepID=A0A9W9Z4F6_9CNID|nr:hypothetical protein OS493_011155 [Desmophyllum pertusum]